MEMTQSADNDKRAVELNDLPDALQPHLAGFVTDSVNLKADSCADVVFFSHPDREGLFLKIRNLSVAPHESKLRSEQIAMSWLEGKLSVPRVVPALQRKEIDEFIKKVVAVGTRQRHSSQLHR